MAGVNKERPGGGEESSRALRHFSRGKEEEREERSCSPMGGLDYNQTDIGPFL